jgi:hypothetical protein
VAAGSLALFSNTAGTDNDATGTGALLSNTGSRNVATGSAALENNAGASNNTAIGFDALLNSTGAANLALGSGAGKNLTTGSNNIDIANPGVAGESGTVRIGTTPTQTAAYVAGVWGKTAGGPTKAVVINKNGRLATGPAPAAPVSAQAQTVGRLRAALHKQRIDNRRQDAAIQRLQREVQAGG